jgi:hypothetical protein
MVKSKVEEVWWSRRSSILGVEVCVCSLRPRAMRDFDDG